MALMENRRVKVPARSLTLDQDNEVHELKELRRSHLKLQALIALIPSERRAELVELLEALVKDGESGEGNQEIARLDRGRRILQIVSEAGRTAISGGETIQYEPERRMGERRKGDRRQPLNNIGKPWTPEQIETLRNLAIQNTPIRRIALKLGRTSTAIQLKAKEIDLPLSLIV